MKRYVQVCPKCGSENIGLDSSNPLQWATGIPEQYSCFDCGHTGRFFPEIETTNKKKISPKFKEKSKIKSQPLDTSYGHFYNKIMFKITGPIMIMGGIFLAVAQIILLRDDFLYVYGILLLILGILASALGYKK